MKNLMVAGFAIAGLLAVTAHADQSYSPRAGKSYPLNVYWGDTHLHTTNSADAGLVGNSKLGPDEAFRFARGEEVVAHNGMTAKLNRPLDFLVVSDHAEYLGLIPNIRDSNPDLLKTEWGKRWHDMFKSGSDEAYRAAQEVVSSMGTRDQKIKDENLTRSIWEANNAAADGNNEPGRFTAFVGFEWTSMPGGGNNLHRVVIYRDDAKLANQMLPFSAFDSEDPEDLWAYLETYEKKTGGKVIALAHNGNVSNGLMFSEKDFAGKPITKAYSETRARWEPLYEVTQIKGDGEAHPVLSPDDEFADYETWDRANLLGTEKKEEWMLQHEYARSALKLGLQFEEKLGANPFKFGLVGSTDSHTSFATAEENNQWGKITSLEPSAKRGDYKMIESTVDPKLNTYGWDMASSGYAAVWATENTREALFDAMQRRETYATTGPRIVLRFFGGWNFDKDDAHRPNTVDLGYERGVPMGGDLTNAPNDKAPSFMLLAAKDPESGNLDRLQIIKGWLDSSGELHEKVYNVAASDDREINNNALMPVGNTVDVKNATFTNTIGDAQLDVVWTDPDFDPKERAFYYARVIEIPTPRWTAFDAKYFKLNMPEGTEMITQERAYSSPIWYTP